MRRCRECQIELTVENSIPKRLWCKPCMKEYMRSYNQRPEVKEKRQARRKPDREALSVWFNALKNKPCQDCKQKFHPICMDWHHLEDKSVDARYGMFRLLLTKGKSVMLEEIKKCILICSNCHRLRHLS